MQLKLTRSQREGGVIATSVVFCLDARAELSAEERSNVHRYKLGNQVLYSSETAKRHADTAMGHLDNASYGSQGQRWGGLAKGLAYVAMSKLALNITIDSLQRGHHIECKDLNEVIATENALYTACENLQEYLTRAATFDGRETILLFTKDGTEERPPDPLAVSHQPVITQQPTEALPAPSVAAIAPSEPVFQSASGPSFARSNATSDSPFDEYVEKFKYWWSYRTGGQRIFFVIAGLIVLWLLIGAIF